MSYFVVGVGGSGAKLMHSLVHLSAAGLLPDGGRTLLGYLVDPDESNGSVHECSQVAALYSRCKGLQIGSKTSLFKNRIELTGPLSPVEGQDVANLNSFFDYTSLSRTSPDEAALMELLFSPAERELKILQGFRGRPAIGATVFGKTVDFEDADWKKLGERALAARTHAAVPLLLAGSVFGGSGAAGVPTICRLLSQHLRAKIDNLRVGLILFLPYFTYDPVPGEPMQADPHQFPSATAEALKYYDEGDFLDFCDEIYALGERYPAKMPRSSVGAKDQRNPPHFLEMIAGLGAVRFLGGTPADDAEHVVSLAARAHENTLQWADLPTAAGEHPSQTAKLQQMILFAVAYHYVLYPTIESGDRNNPILDHLEDVPGHDAAEDLAAVDAYLVAFLSWLLSISTPERAEAPAVFSPGLVDPDVFAVRDGYGWRLKTRKVAARKGGGEGEFREKDIGRLFRNLETKVQPNLRDIHRSSNTAVQDPDARGAGKLVRAIYDACKLA